MDAPFPYFGGKSRAASAVWPLFGNVKNYVEPFAGSLAMLLQAPYRPPVATVNDRDAFICNFWRAVSSEPNAVAYYADWPVNEADLEARHAWLVGNKSALRNLLNDPNAYDVKVAGWWVWGACSWIGSGWCEGAGPWQFDDESGLIVDRRQLPHLGNAGRGINRQLPHLGNAGQGINRKLPHLGDAGRGAAIADWFNGLQSVLRDVRVACGDWSRVLSESVTVRHGMTAIFLDPPYSKGAMQYASGGMREGISDSVRHWCMTNGTNAKMRIVLCGHNGEHDDLLAFGWNKHYWTARRGYAASAEALANSKSETLWASPYCVGGCLEQAK